MWRFSEAAQGQGREDLCSATSGNSSSSEMQQWNFVGCGRHNSYPFGIGEEMEKEDKVPSQQNPNPKQNQKKQRVTNQISLLLTDPSKNARYMFNRLLGEIDWKLRKENKDQKSRNFFFLSIVVFTTISISGFWSIFIFPGCCTCNKEMTRFFLFFCFNILSKRVWYFKFYNNKQYYNTCSLID